MPAANLGRRRPRPVADVPAVDGRELARAWLVELVAAAPLERAAALPGPGFALRAPRLCAAVVDALATEAAYDDLEPGGTHAPLAADAAVIAGAEGAAEAVTALDALRAVTWSLLLDELHRPPPSLLTDLADRLGATMATITAAALEGGTTLTAATRAGDRGPLAAILRGDEAPGPADDASPEPDEEARPRREGDPLLGADDRRSPDTARGAVGDREADAVVGADAARGGDRFAGAAVDALPDHRAPGPREWAPSPAGPVVEDGSDFVSRVAPWTAAVERRLQRHSDDGLPFALLCVEVADLDRLVAADRDRDVAKALEAAEAAVCAQLRPADVLVRERPGRYWLVAPDTDGDAARSLAHLLAAAVAGVPGHRGAPLEAAVGLAVAPNDGVDAPALEGRAEEGLFAARAAGLRVASSPRD
ncbi:MAG TPA: hypothetical protein VF549_10550 [Solirubrobacteraceae bacterium]|jgi:GGDEF domain-containing protein